MEPIALTPPAFEIRLILPAPGMGWEFTVKRLGKIVAASDGDEVHPHAGQALKAAFVMTQAAGRREHGEG